MKLGIITDVHSNIQALNAVLKEFDKLKVNKIICCGDMIGIGANPEETMEILIKRKEDLVAVRGNHEEYLLKGLPKEVHNNKRKMSIDEIKNHEWTHNELTESSKMYLGKLPNSKTIIIENKKIYIVHYPIKENGEYKEFIKKPNIDDIKELFYGIDADIYLYGHTHTANVHNKDGKWYINPGSLGCPMKSNIAIAGMLDINEKEVQYKQLNIEYNVSEVIQEIEKIKFPFYKDILKIFYGM